MRLANHSDLPFEGWKRCTIDTTPQFPAGDVGESRYVVGCRLGRNLHVLDVWCRLAPGERKTLDLATAVENNAAAPRLPSGSFWGGALKINGLPMRLVQMVPDGAAVVAHFCMREAVNLIPAEAAVVVGLSEGVEMPTIQVSPNASPKPAWAAC